MRGCCRPAYDLCCLSVVAIPKSNIPMQHVVTRSQGGELCWKRGCQKALRFPRLPVQQQEFRIHQLPSPMPELVWTRPPKSVLTLRLRSRELKVAPIGCTAN